MTIFGAIQKFTDFFTNFNTLLLFGTMPMVYDDWWHMGGLATLALLDRPWHPVQQAVSWIWGSETRMALSFFATPLVLILEANVLSNISNELGGLGPVYQTLASLAWIGGILAMNLIYATVGIFFVGIVATDAYGALLGNIEEFTHGQAIAMTLGFHPHPYVTIIHPSPNGFPNDEDLETLAPKQLVVEGEPPENRHECGICLSEIDSGMWRMLPCGGEHCFHTECCDPWLRTHDTCPMCQQIIKVYEVPEDNPIAAEAEQVMMEEDAAEETEAEIVTDIDDVD
jgi:hypothetical protein